MNNYSLYLLIFICIGMIVSISIYFIRRNITNRKKPADWDDFIYVYLFLSFLSSFLTTWISLGIARSSNYFNIKG